MRPGSERNSRGCLARTAERARHLGAPRRAERRGRGLPPRVSNAASFLGCRYPRPKGRPHDPRPSPAVRPSSWSRPRRKGARRCPATKPTTRAVCSLGATTAGVGQETYSNRINHVPSPDGLQVSRCRGDDWAQVSGERPASLECARCARPPASPGEGRAKARRDVLASSSFTWRSSPSASSAALGRRSHAMRARTPHHRVPSRASRASP